MSNEKVLPDGKMKPVIIIPKGAISREDIERLNANGLCTVEADDPAKVKFLDPIPAAAQRGKVEDAAIMLSRRLLQLQGSTTKAEVAQMFAAFIIQGTPLDPQPSKEDRARGAHDEAYFEEVRRIARQEAKEDRAAARAAKQAEKTKK